MEREPPEQCEIIGEEVETHTVWYACQDTDETSLHGIECEQVDFGTGGGPGFLPQDGEVLCKATLKEPGEAVGSEKRDAWGRLIAPNYPP
eukprot:CAMPEP_0119332182 /NCGR_PEP_ID=MMETSP1333-20130426/82188_1 /TAXON_ID=418940 /ORGANISM="Scyphosphaera apsteinii, Strain RCC1455" /LENGTH=89 /DNA_ID=CAMNT_0007341955 /DNA_START=156 /DNA_END=425 /DNA_ORIENTATION=+